jgi:hypothetical protein
MAFTAANLLLVSNQTPQVFKYSTNDLLNDVTASGYFNSATAKLQKGDLILVAGDLDGTPFTTQVSVNSATGAATVTVVDLATATLTFAERVVLTVGMAAVGTSSTKYVVSPIAGTVSYFGGVLDASGAGSGGTSTVTMTVPTTGAIATLPFLQDTAAGAAIVDSTITAHTALAAGGVITLATDGTGSHTGAAELTIMITPS